MLVLVLVHRTLDEMHVHIHVPMLIVQNCTRLYCLDLANQYWPSGEGCDRTPLSCDLHMGLFVLSLYYGLCEYTLLDTCIINTEVHVLFN